MIYVKNQSGAVIRHQGGEMPKLPPTQPPCGHDPTKPGSLVKIILNHIGYPSTANCACERKCRLMDAWGWAGCAMRHEKIVKWFVNAARTEGIEVDASTLTALLIGGLKDRAGAIFQKLGVGSSARGWGARG